MPRDEVVITEIRRFRIKSCMEERLSEALLLPMGIEGDRDGGVIGADGKVLTQREIARMAVIKPDVISDRLQLNAPFMDPLQIQLNRHGGKGQIRVKIWDDYVWVRDQGDEAAEWLSFLLDRPCRLVWATDDFDRQVDPRYAGPGHKTRLADGYPVLLTNESTRVEVSQQIGDDIPMSRFRPNLVISGLPAFAEERLSALELPNGARLNLVKLCARCQITAIDQNTGEKTGKEPLSYLAKHHLVPDQRGKKGAMFGQNATVDCPPEGVIIRVGDVVKPIYKQAA